MTDYRVTVKVQNNNILSKIESLGFKSAGHFCRETGYSPQTLHRFTSMKEIPIIKRTGELRKSILELCDILDCIPEELFSAVQMEEALEKNTASRNLTQQEMENVLKLHAPVEQKSLENAVFEEERNGRLFQALDSLTRREKMIIEMRFGLNGATCTREEIADKLGGISSQRVRQIEMKAMRKLRHPSRWNISSEELMED